jgi:hypothetical protein
VFCADIAGVDDSVYERLLAAASATRRERAAGYRRREDAVRCVVAEALLRYACGGALPAVQADSMGKPRFPDRPELCFNLSHGGRWVVLAWSGTEVGIDVEPIRMDENRQALCRRFFSPEEEAFYTMVVANARRKWQSSFGDVPFSFSITPGKNARFRKQVTMFKDTRITAWDGRFRIMGDPQVLNFLYHTGLGSKSSQGFGMFRLL